MDKDKPQTEVPENSGDVKIKIPDTGGSVSVEDVKKDTESKFKEMNYLVYGVVIVLLIMVATLIIDSFHFNSATYKEYSEKINDHDQVIKMNQALLDENTKLQRVIENQTEIINLSKK